MLPRKRVAGLSRLIQQNRNPASSIARPQPQQAASSPLPQRRPGFAGDRSIGQPQGPGGFSRVPQASGGARRTPYNVGGRGADPGAYGGIQGRTVAGGFSGGPVQAAPPPVMGGQGGLGMPAPQAAGGPGHTVYDDPEARAYGGSTWGQYHAPPPPAAIPGAMGGQGMGPQDFVSLQRSASNRAQAAMGRSLEMPEAEGPSMQEQAFTKPTATHDGYIEPDEIANPERATMTDGSGVGESASGVAYWGDDPDDEAPSRPIPHDDPRYTDEGWEEYQDQLSRARADMWGMSQEAHEEMQRDGYYFTDDGNVLLNGRRLNDEERELAKNRAAAIDARVAASKAEEARLASQQEGFDLIREMMAQETPRFDEGAINEKLYADRAARARDTARAMRAQMEMAARGGMSPGAMGAQQTSAGVDAAIAGSQQDANTRLGYEKMNYESALRQYQSQVQGLMAMAQSHENEAVRAAAFQQAKELSRMQNQLRMEYGEFMDSLGPSFGEQLLLTGVGGLLGAGGQMLGSWVGKA